ncbi:hypothetical protein E4O00_12320 [Treponema sp. OMZ 788]|uniref:hypothetical protein n=1 Tax=Treponema sp. OMZ 788 TaxID=2563664 RepID=UPI0020A4A6A4|nr:hypothetical protein [Treponema sp. OMZ 788]UTC64533.1 hypothetical protein E4O00_12320 [Treponema sp. OMZ 788]
MEEEIEIKKNTSLVNKYTEVITRKDLKIEELSNFVKECKSIVEKTQKENKQLISEKARLEERLTQQDSKIEELSASVIKYINIVEKAQEENKQLIAESSRLQERLTQWDSKIEELSAAVEKYKNLAVENDKKYEMSQATNNHLRLEKLKLDQAIIELNQKLETLKRQVIDKETLINSYTATIDQKDLKIEKLSAAAEDYKNFATENDRKYETLQKELSRVNSENDDLREQLSISRLENTHLIDEKRKLIEQKSEAESELHTVKEILVYYNSLKIDKLEKAYKIFISFKERTRNNLKAVFETDTFLGFISNSMQWARIEGIWEQTKRKIVNDDNEDLQELRKLFLILFETYNEGYTDAPYELINPIIGSRYNSNEQLIKNQKSDGTVTEVLLEGYVFKKTGVAHRAMILVE